MGEEWCGGCLRDDSIKITGNMKGGRCVRHSDRETSVRAGNAP